MELVELLEIIKDRWENRYQRGRLQQVYVTHHANDGRTYRVSLTIQQVEIAPTAPFGNIVDLTSD